MNHSITLNFSDNALQRGRRRMLVIGLCMPVFFAAFLLLSPIGRISSGTGIAVAIIILVVIEAILIIESGIFLQKLKEMTLAVSPEGIERTGGSFTEKISFSEMRKAVITEYPSGQVASIKVESSNKKTLILGGFEKMDWIAQQIESAIPDKSMVIRKRQSIDWDQSWILVATMIPTFVAILLIQRLGWPIYRVLNILFLIGYGLVSLVYRPISRSMGKRFEKFEIILGALMVFSGAFIAIGLLGS